MAASKLNERRILREKERAQITGVPISSWYALQARGQAPRPVRLSAKSVGWWSDEIDAWVNSREKAAA